MRGLRAALSEANNVSEGGTRWVMRYLDPCGDSLLNSLIDPIQDSI